MVFSSTVFLFVFLPITLLGYYLIRGEGKNYWLLLVSLVFFGWSQPNYLWIILLNIAVNYFCAMLIDRWRTIKKPVLFFTVLANISILFYYKYFDFAIASVNKAFGTSLELQNIILPIGISFFTFQGLSYVIDVYRDDVAVQRNPFKVALYITLFPQLIAGPIVRYSDIAGEIDTRRVKTEDFCYGIERFIIGLSKKVLIANTMASLVDSVWSNDYESIGWQVAWIAGIAYTLQIYFDFSGYSDMAIGLGRMFGFHFCENFDLPYTSKNITEFWRRWHISLSSWFRDYVYIPLGGNRKNVYLNLSVVFLLTGVWHGASWHFVAWGVWNGFFILLERCIKMKKKQKQTSSEQRLFSSVLSRVYTLLVVNFGWVLFRAPHTRDALLFVRSMFGMVDGGKIGFTLLWYLDKWSILMMALGILFSTGIPKRSIHFIKGKMNENIYSVLKYGFLLAVFCFSVMRVVSGTYNPFIYFQF